MLVTYPAQKNTPIFQGKKDLPERKIILTEKHGRTVIRDEFIGQHVMTPNIFEVLQDLGEDLAYYCSKIYKKFRK